MEFQSLLVNDHYWLKKAHVPICLLRKPHIYEQTREGLCLVDLEIVDGKITTILPSNIVAINQPSWDLHHGIVFPCFVDMHTHLDKGHIWERSPNLNGAFDDAVTIVQKDAQKYWQPEELYRRMEFGIKCSYAHGTRAIRTHLDSFGEQGEVSWKVFQDLQQTWRDQVLLQGVTLVTLDYWQTDPGVTLADKISEVDGILGGVAYPCPELDQQLDTIFTLAKQRNLDLDFHADENNNPNSHCLERIAAAALRHQFPGKIVCGHCCSLAVQSPEIVAQTIALVKEAGIYIVSLPSCNLFLQDRQPGITPRWRGITLVHELKQAGIPVSFASDNCRDPFYGFGDHDIWEVWQQAVRIAHLDAPYGDWISSVTTTAAEGMGLSEVGKIGIGKPADLVIFKARYFSELLARSQHDRIVLRDGRPIDTSLPDYAELDQLVVNYY